ncbi:MAG: zinc-binding alcohol dehydrogenase family protein [Microbacteriaceae bacterium]
MHTTRAIGYSQNHPIDHPDSIIEREIPVPELGSHDLLVEVRAVSVNPVDVKVRQGAPANGFKVLGYDASGVVRAVGEGVTLFSVGDEVFYAGQIDKQGTNQALHTIDERVVGRKPTTLSFTDAASLPLTTITAWECLFDRLGLTEASRGTLLIVGATGGVGSVMMQLCEALLPGVTVIATASSPERVAWALERGAEHTVNHHADLAAEVLEIAPDGVEWIFTAHSKGQVETYERIIRPFGHIVAIDDGPTDVTPLKIKSVAWHWERMFTRSMFQAPDMIEQHHLLNATAALVDAGKVTATTTRVLSPLTSATVREAHELIETGRTVGKLVIAVNEQESEH